MGLDPSPPPLYATCDATVALFSGSCVLQCHNATPRNNTLQRIAGCCCQGSCVPQMSHCNTPQQHTATHYRALFRGLSCTSNVREMTSTMHHCDRGVFSRACGKKPRSSDGKILSCIFQWILCTTDCARIRLKLDLGVWFVFCNTDCALIYLRCCRCARETERVSECDSVCVCVCAHRRTHTHTHTHTHTLTHTLCLSHTHAHTQ